MINYNYIVIFFFAIYFLFFLLYSFLFHNVFFITSNVLFFFAALIYILNIQMKNILLKKIFLFFVILNITFVIVSWAVKIYLLSNPVFDLESLSGDGFFDSIERSLLFESIILVLPFILNIYLVFGINSRFKLRS